MSWQRAIVLGHTTWSLGTSELRADQTERTSCSPGFALGDLFRFRLVEPPEQLHVTPRRCFSIEFLSASLLSGGGPGCSPTVSGNAKNKRAGLQKHNKQRHWEIFAGRFLRGHGLSS